MPQQRRPSGHGALTLLLHSLLHRLSPEPTTSLYPCLARVPCLPSVECACRMVAVCQEVCNGLKLSTLHDVQPPSQVAEAACAPELNAPACTQVTSGGSRSLHWGQTAAAECMCKCTALTTAYTTAVASLEVHAPPYHVSQSPRLD
jgi:hypothetical protein